MRKAFARVLEQVCGYEKDSRPRIAMDCCGITTVQEFCDYVSDELKEDLETPDLDDSGNAIDGSFTRIPKFEISRLVLLQKWLRDLNRNDTGANLLTVEFLDELKPEDFNKFRTSSWGDTSPNASQSPGSAGSSGGTSTRSPSSPEEKALADFNKGIKRDMSAFPVFKDGVSFEQHYMVTRATAKAQGVSEVLDPNYTPTTDIKKKLFAAKTTLCSRCS